MQINWHDVRIFTVAVGIASMFIIPTMFWLGYTVGFQEGLKEAFKLLGLP